MVCPGPRQRMRRAVIGSPLGPGSSATLSYAQERFQPDHGGSNGLAQRQSYYHVADRVLGVLNVASTRGAGRPLPPRSAEPVFTRGWEAVRVDAKRRASQAEPKPKPKAKAASAKSRRGYYVHLGEHVYLYPTAAFTYNRVISGSTSVRGTNYHVEKLAPNASLHAGDQWGRR